MFVCWQTRCITYASEKLSSDYMSNILILFYLLKENLYEFANKKSNNIFLQRYKKVNGGSLVKEALKSVFNKKKSGVSVSTKVCYELKYYIQII